MIEKNNFPEQGWQWHEVPLPRSFEILLAPFVRQEFLRSVPSVNCEESHCRAVTEGRTTPQVRCCDIIPKFANFLTGEILLTMGSDVIEEWIDRRRGDPYYIQVPPILAKKYIQARHAEKFGLPCPLLTKSGRCSIYPLRPPSCIGYHCYYPDYLWFEAWACLTSTLELLQDIASRYLVAQSSLQLEEMANIWNSIEEEEELWEGESQREEFYSRLWQHWKGKERGFYIRTYRILRDEKETIRKELHKMRKLFLSHQLLSAGKLTDAREQELRRQEWKDHCEEPLPPPDTLRQRYQKGLIPPEENELTLLEQQRILLWYLQQLREPTLWQKIKELLNFGRGDIPTNT